MRRQEPQEVCAQCGGQNGQQPMPRCDLCGQPVCDHCLVEDYSGNISPLQPPETRHASCVGYWTPRRQRRKGGA